jgi:L-lactate dehydrogenase complex protein LldG
LEAALAALPTYAGAARVASLVPGVQRQNVDLSATADPHQLDDVDFCVLPAVLGVAENGAVWITDHGGKNRAVAFLTQHLAVVLRGEDLVADLHQAYARLQLERPGFALFLSGPSKTADIEQALVIGAHGARSCTVFLVG